MATRLNNSDLPEHLKLDERFYKIVRDEIISYIDENNYVVVLIAIRDSLVKDSDDHQLHEGTPMKERIVTAHVLDIAIDTLLEEQRNIDNTGAR